jgi:hypothetical protein
MSYDDDEESQSSWWRRHFSTDDFERLLAGIDQDLAEFKSNEVHPVGPSKPPASEPDKDRETRKRLAAMRVASVLFADFDEATREHFESLFYRRPRLADGVTNEWLRRESRRIVDLIEAHRNADDLTSLQRVDLVPHVVGDIEPVRPTVLQREDGQGLFYRGRVNGLFGDSGIGKSWVAAWTIADLLAEGAHCMFIDLEEPSPTSTIGRLLQTGVSDWALDNEGKARSAEDARLIIPERLHYYAPTTQFTDSWITELIGEINEHDIAVVFIDSLGEAFALHGVNEDRDNEVAPWFRHYVRPLADQTNAAVTTIDHSTKSRDNPLFPSGSKRKRAAVTGAMYVVEASEPMTLEQGGRLRLITAKDRHGTYRHGEPAAVLDFRPKPDGPWSLKVWVPLGPDDDDNATVRIMAAANKAVQTLKAKGCPLIKTDLGAFMGSGDDRVKRAGINEAIRQGAIEEVVAEHKRGKPHYCYYVRDLDLEDEQ